MSIARIDTSRSPSTACSCCRTVSSPPRSTRRWTRSSSSPD